MNLLHLKPYIQEMKEKKVWYKLWQVPSLYLPHVSSMHYD